MNTNKFDELVYQYRMMGFDKPDITYNKYFNCYTLDVRCPCGQWKMIKGNSEFSCITGAIAWAKINQRRIDYERRKLMHKFPKKKYYQGKKKHYKRT